MTEWANPRQRVWFRLKPGLTREAAFDAAAGLLLRHKPDGAGIYSFSIYPSGEGGSDDPQVVTFMWELMFLCDDKRGWDWGHERQSELAAILERELGAS